MRSRSTVSSLKWAAFTVAAAGTGALIPLLFYRGFYFVDDSQTGAYGQWYEIGARLTRGDWSLLNPTVWQAGNYLAEGSWGLFSPIHWVIGLATLASPSALLIVTAVKIVFIVIAALGVFLLARSYGASPAWSSVAGVAAPLAGFTLYMDAASWVNGLIAWALFAWAWWGIRATNVKGANPLAAIVPSLLLIGVGYVHGTVMLGVLLLGTLLEFGLRRDWRRFLSTVKVSVIAGSMALAVHLPGFLTAPVSGRQSGTFNTGLLVADLTGILSSSTPVGNPQVALWSSFFATVPLLYIAWFVPLAALFVGRGFGRWLKAQLALVTVLLFSFLFVQAPSDFGPLRFPVRLMPYLVVGVVICLAVGLSRFRPATRSPRRLVVAFSLLGVSALASLTQAPGLVRPILLVTLLAAVAVAVIDRVLTRGGPPRRLHGESSAAIVTAAVVLIMLVPQHYVHPESPLRSLLVPTTRDAYQTQLADAVGDAIVVGAPRVDSPVDPLWSQTLLSNGWYVNGHPVHNTYSAVYYPGYNAQTCMAFNGTTCGDLYSRLFERVRGTGSDLADLLAVSSVQVLKASVPRDDWREVPDGWSVVEDTPETRLIVRDAPVAGAGGVVWTSEGTEVRITSQTRESVELNVDSVGAGGGRVALSRIPWPGYSASGAAIASDPYAGFLLTLDLPENAEGSTVHVQYRPPGWPIVLVGLGVALIGGAAWSLWHAIRRRRPTRMEQVHLPATRVHQQG